MFDLFFGMALSHFTPAQRRVVQEAYEKGVTMDNLILHYFPTYRDQVEIERAKRLIWKWSKRYNWKTQRNLEKELIMARAQAEIKELNHSKAVPREMKPANQALAQQIVEMGEKGVFGIMSLLKGKMEKVIQNPEIIKDPEDVSDLATMGRAFHQLSGRNKDTDPAMPNLWGAKSPQVRVIDV